MIKNKIVALLFATGLYVSAIAQATHVITDVEKDFKEAKELFIQQQYALAYPLFKQLQQDYPENTVSNHTYLNDDITYYNIVCQLKLLQPIAEDEAKHYIDEINNEPRRQLLSYHLAKFYFTKENFTAALQYYERAGLDNLSNEEIADAKFEKAYCYFNLKKFNEAKPLFDEIHQLPGNKYFYAANYYYGFICYFNKQYTEALKAFKLVEFKDEYKAIVPYYIAEIFYFQQKKDEALKYGEDVLNNGSPLFYQKEMKLLIGQLYFEKKNFAKALPLIEYYVSHTTKVDKEVLYELSYCYYEDKQLSKAIDGFKQLTNQNDSLAQNSMYLLGDCYLKTNQKQNARNAFQYCAYNNSNAAQQQVAQFIYAKLSYELGYQDIALSELKKFVSTYPSSIYQTEATELLVGLLANTNNFSEALSLYQSIDKPTIAMQKNYPKILFGKAVENINDQQITKADELFSKILLLPYNTSVLPYTHFWKGEIALRNQKYDEAILFFNTYLQTPTPAQGEANAQTAKYNLGYCWMKKENYPKALNYFEQVTTSVSTTSSALLQDAYLRSADCYYMNNNFAKAKSMYDNVINNALPQSDYAFLQKAMITGIKNSSEKIKILNTLIRQYPQSNLVSDANMEIANTYMADEKFSNAIPYLTNVLNTSGAGGLQPMAYLKLGLSYFNIDDNKNALINYQNLIQKYPQSAEANDALENIKSIYVQQGQPNEYVNFMRKNGKNISVSEADSLTYAAAEIKYNANDCASALIGFKNYLSQYADGAFALEAHYFSAECNNKNKDWSSALIDYNYVNGKGLNRYFENATLQAARINYFELKNYVSAKKYFQDLLSNSINQDNLLEALRGLVRCQYFLNDFATANESAKKLLAQKGISTDDKSIAFLVLGKAQQTGADCVSAIGSFKLCAAINKSAWGAQARYEIANCQFALNNLAAAEKSAMAVIKETGSYDNWVTKAYILLGDIFMQQKDFFNAKATYQSVAKNAVIPELQTEAQQKLDKAIAEEKLSSKVIEK